MELVLVRHARAFERDAAAWPDDARRPLTAEGREAFARFARRLARVRPSVDLVESSGFVRAWQTAQLLAEEAGWPRPSRLERLEPGAADETKDETNDETHDETHDAAQLAALRRSALALRGVGSVAWVGHEPVLSRLASLLLTGSPDALSIRFRKGAALALRLEDRGAGDATDRATPRATLSWMLVPSVAARRRRR
ncbi:MAG: hypothetical protein RIS86_2360 [Planctomycetota bacterium]|jgi:phosphohistidine phosphatase